MWNLTGDDVVIKPRRTLLPVLTVLFLVSYGLLTMLVVEQGRTIDSQRSLIQVLFNDSVQLSNLKGKVLQKQQAEARSQRKAPATPQSPQLQGPVSPQSETKSHGTGKLRRPLPQKPPRDASDEADERRALVSI